MNKNYLLIILLCSAVFETAYFVFRDVCVLFTDCCFLYDLLVVCHVLQ